MGARVTTPSPVALTHLRVKTAASGIGGNYLISRCGIRKLESFYSRRQITINKLLVTCPLCNAPRKARKGKSK